MARLAGTLALLVAVASAMQILTDHPRLQEQRIAFDGVAGDASNGDGPTRISGYFKLDHTHDAFMYFFYFQSRTMKATDPVVLWMTGGPGCSSELALFYENGPYKIHENMTLSLREYGWDRRADMIYVDQPVNTGFSYSDDPADEVYDERGVADDMLDFLNELVLAHPELAGRDFFVTGESYAGHYVPAVSSRLFRALRDREPRLQADIRLRGFAIGNGLTDPEVQYGAYADFAYEAGLISEGVRERILAAYPACRSAIQICNAHDWEAACLMAVTYCQATQVSSILALTGNINIYDIRKPCEGALCYDFSLMERYLALPATRKALGVHKRWEACNMTVYMDMQADWMRNFSSIIPEMLEGGLRALVYAGDKDFICNWVGNSRWVANETWDGKPAQQPASQQWQVDGEDAGLLTDYGAMQFLRVFDAGHMVPMDQPKHALTMINAFVRGEKLVPALGEAAASEA